MGDGCRCCCCCCCNICTPICLQPVPRRHPPPPSLVALLPLPAPDNCAPLHCPALPCPGPAEIYFNSRGHGICGALIHTYLLEKSRVVHQQAGERSYHIFYQVGVWVCGGECGWGQV